MTDNQEMPADQPQDSQPQSQPALNVPQELQQAAEQAHADRAYEVVTDMRTRLGLSPEATEKVMSKLQVVQTDKGIIPVLKMANIRGATDGEFVAVYDKQNGMSQYDLDAVRDALAEEMGNAAFVAPVQPADEFKSYDDSQSFAAEQQRYKRDNITPVDADGGYEVQSGRDGDLFQSAPKKPLLIRKSEAQDMNTYKAAKAEAQRRGVELRIIEDKTPDVAIYDSTKGDIRMPPNYTLKQWKEARDNAMETGRGIFDYEGKMIVPRKR